MRLVHSALLLVSVALSGCTTAHRLAQDDRAAFAEAQASLVGRTVTIERVGGPLSSGRLLRLYPDSTSWIDEGSQRVVTVPTEEVAEIERLSRSMGFLDGLLYGAIVGGVSVGTLAYLDLRDGYDAECTLLCGLHEAVTVTLALLGATAGGTLGGSVGAVRGSRERYHLGRHEAPLDSSLVYRRTLPARGYSATTSNAFE